MLTPQRSNAFATLRQYTQADNRPVERCELCSQEIPSWHRHLLEVSNRQVVCACDACALRFHDVVAGRYKLVPRDAYALPGFSMTEAQWDGFAVPINLAFFSYSTPGARMLAQYPGAAGVVESLLPLDTWDTLVAENPSLADMQPDVEALLVNRVGAAQEYYRVPIDACYKLAGLIRTRWRGLSGGEEVWAAVKQFFIELKQKSVFLPAHKEVPHGEIRG